MSAASFVPKTIKNIFKRSKRRNQDETADTVTIGDSHTTGSPDYRHPNPQDYFPSGEAVGTHYEDYDLYLGLAISESESAAQTAAAVDGTESQFSTRYMASYSNGPSSHSEALSSFYYFNGIVDYDERITDGFYDVWGEFKEVIRSKPFPSLRSLKRFRLEDGDLREAVLFNRSRDPIFPLIENAAQEAMLKLMGRGRVAIIQALAQIVSAQMGGAVPDERALLRGWQRCSQKLKRRYRSAVYPIGKLRVGLSRHRAFMYKVLADGLSIGCRLVRGYPYHPSNAQAVALVIVDNTEVIVDLLIQPGRLLKLEAGPGETGTQVVFAEAPGMPSEPYWVPCTRLCHHWALSRLFCGYLGFQKSSKRYETLPEGSCLDAGAPKTSVEKIAEDANRLQGQKGALQSAVPSAFSAIRVPFDPTPTQNATLDIARDDSSVMSSGPRQPSDASSNSSIRVGMKTQNSGTSLFSEGNGWTEEADSPRVVNRAVQAPEARLLPSRVPSNNLEDETKKPVTTSYPPPISSDSVPASQPGVPVMMTSAFMNCDLPNWDDDDEPASSHQDSGNATLKSTCPRDDSIINNKQSSLLVVTPMPLERGEMLCLLGRFDQCIVRLGVGSYGEVFKGTWRGTEVAVKRLLEQDVSRQILEEFLLEVRIMKRLRHPNVLLFMGACMQPPDLAIVTEYLPRGSLYRLLHKTSILTDQRLKLRMARDVAKGIPLNDPFDASLLLLGMCYLHSFKPAVVHRDLKSPNLLVDKDWTVKVCDFGMSRMKANTYLSGKGTAGTPEWTAPEVLRNEPSDEKCDVYSYGVILYELVTGLEPWANLKPMQVVGAVGFGGAQLTLPAEVDPRIASIIKQCWSRDSHSRPSFSELLKLLSQFDSLPCLPRPT